MIVINAITNLRSCSLRAHVKSIHEGIRHECNQCNHQFTTQQNLKDHLQAVHEGIKYDCSQCDVQFSFLKRLRSHIRANHKNV